MSRNQLINQLKVTNPKLTKSEIEEIINIFCNEIEKALKDGRSVEIRDFGTFSIKKIREKFSARNPKTGQLIYVPEKNKVRFKASKKLKKIIKNSQTSKIKFGYKFGLEFLNSKHGRKFLSNLNNEITFGDYKLADIPNTCSSAIKAVKDLKLNYLTY